jgi:hypothetical protein
VRELYHDNLEDDLERLPSRMRMHLNVLEDDPVSILLLKKLREYQNVHEDDHESILCLQQMRELHDLEDDLENNLYLNPHLDLMLDANLHPLNRCWRVLCNTQYTCSVW